MSQQFEFPKRQQMPPINVSPRTIIFVVVAIVALWLLSGIYTVAPDEKAVVLRFGEVNDIVDPGLHYHDMKPHQKFLIEPPRLEKQQSTLCFLSTVPF